MTARVQRNMKSEGNIGEAVEQEESNVMKRKQ